MTTNLTPKVGRWPTRIFLDSSNCDARLWYSEKKDAWHWTQVWEDGCPWGTHMHHGIAPSKEKARADIVATMVWIEDKWPSPEYFQGV